MPDKKPSKRMFEGLPDIVYIIIGWIGYIYMIYAYAVAVVYYGYHAAVDPRGCGPIVQPICNLEKYFITQDRVYMSHEKSWEGWDSRAQIYANNIFWFALFMLQHSGMKSKFFKETLFPVSERLERPLYMLAASFTFQMCFTMQCPLPTVIYEFENWNIMFGLGITMFLGQLLLFVTTFHLDHWSFCGITQAYGREPENLPFGKTGLYGIVRHPQYFFQLIAFWFSHKKTESEVLYSVLMTLYIVLAVRYLEEPALIELIGEDYIEYTHEVPAYCPLRLPGCFMSQERRKKTVIKKQKAN